MAELGYNQLKREYLQKVKECERWQKKFEIIKTILEHNELRAAEDRAYKDSIVLIKQEEIDAFKTQLSMASKKKRKKKKSFKCLLRSNVKVTSAGEFLAVPSYYEILQKKDIEITEAQQTIREMKIKDLERQSKIKELEAFTKQIILAQSTNNLKIEFELFQSIANNAENKIENHKIKEAKRKSEAILNQKKQSTMTAIPSQSKSSYPKERRITSCRDKINSLINEIQQFTKTNKRSFDATKLITEESKSTPSDWCKSSVVTNQKKPFSKSDLNTIEIRHTKCGVQGNQHHVNQHEKEMCHATDGSLYAVDLYC